MNKNRTDTDEVSMAEAQLRILLRLTSAQKLAVARGLRETACALAATGVRLREPQLSEIDVQARTREIFRVPSLTDLILALRRATRAAGRVVDGHGCHGRDHLR